MKKILLIGFLFLSLFAGAQDTFESNQIVYLITGESTVETQKYNGVEVSVVVPEKVQNNGKTYTVTAIGAESFSWTKVESVDMPSTIESIGDKAFQYAEIKTVKLPENLKKIGKSAYSSAKITELEIPASVVEIGENAFLSCSNLERIKFNDGLKTIAAGAFYHLPKLTELHLPKTLETIGSAAFSKCTALKTMVLPEELATIGDAAFMGCAKMSNVTLPNKLKTIGTEAFLNCSGLTTVNIPASVEKLGDSFMAATSISSITVDPSSEHFYLKDNNALYGKKQNILYLVLMRGLTNLAVQDDCVGVNGGACWGSEIEQLTLPNTLLAIGDHSFFGIKATKVDLPNSLTFIGQQAFAETKLTEVVIPENVTLLSKGVFGKCENLITVTLPSSIEEIDNLAFGFDAKLAKVIYKGKKVPEIIDYSEDYYSPFYNIASGAELVVPKGCSEAFKEAHWDEYFAIVESELGVLSPVGTDPSDGSVMEGYKPMTFKITFDEEVSVATETPEVTLRKNAVFYPNVFTADGSWHVTLNSDKKSVNVWAGDADGAVQLYNFNENIEYFLVIPSQIVKNAAGESNERIVLRLVANETTAIDGTVSNEGNASVVGYYNINGQRIPAPVRGINIVKYSDGSIKKMMKR